MLSTVSDFTFLLMSFFFRLLLVCWGKLCYISFTGGFCVGLVLFFWGGGLDVLGVCLLALFCTVTSFRILGGRMAFVPSFRWEREREASVPNKKGAAPSPPPPIHPPMIPLTDISLMKSAFAGAASASP